MKVTLTIRRKLFLGFLAVVAVPLVMVALLSRSYVQRTRADLDQRFMENSRMAFRRMNDRASSNLKLLNAVVHELAVSVKGGHIAGAEDGHGHVVEVDDDEFIKATMKTDSKSGKHAMAVRDLQDPFPPIKPPHKQKEPEKQKEPQTQKETENQKETAAPKPPTFVDPFASADAKADRDRVAHDTRELVAHLSGVDRLVSHAIAIATKHHVLDHLVDSKDPKVAMAIDAANNALDHMDSSMSAEVPKPPQHELEETVARLRREYPALLGIEVRLDGEDQLQPCGIDFKNELWNSVDQLHDTGSTIWMALPAGDFLFERFNSSDNGSGVAAKVDARQVSEVAILSRSGRAFYVDVDKGVPWHAPDEAKHVTSVLPVAALAKQVPLPGQLLTVTIGANRYRIYTAPDSERSSLVAPSRYPLVSVVLEDEIYKPLLVYELKQAAAILLSLLVAIALSYFLSGRFVGAVENIQRGVDALSRGEFAQLQKLSGDELGSGLVESMNRMATVLQERTRREEVEGWRRLVRVLSHEINNTLGPVRSVAVTVRDQVAPKLGTADVDEAAEDLQLAFRLIVDRVDSLSSFISGYAELAKLPAPARVRTDLNDVVRAAVGMLKQTAEQMRVIVHEVYGDDVRAQLDGGQIERVAINLIKNAIEAARHDVVVRTVGLSTGVELIVEDDGPGIAPDARRMLFVPYFTTKPGGSGIGLALARQIVLGHGGSISAEDRPSPDRGGAVLRVRLPSVVAPSAA